MNCIRNLLGEEVDGAVEEVLDAVGTSLAVQQKLMRHADIRTTMNVYGDVVTDEVRQAQGKVTALALPITGEIGLPMDRKAS